MAGYSFAVILASFSHSDEAKLLVCFTISHLLLVVPNFHVNEGAVTQTKTQFLGIILEIS